MLWDVPAMVCGCLDNVDPNPKVVTVMCEHWLALANVETMFMQLCVNVVPRLYFNHNPNVATTLCESWPMSANIETMFRQCCVNFVSMVAPNIVLVCFRSIMTVTFKLEFSTYLQHQQSSLHWNNHNYKHSWIILPTTAVELTRWWIFNKFPQ